MMVRTQFRMEMIVYTQDSRYSKKLGKRKRDETIIKPMTMPDSGANLREMMKHLKSYYQVSVFEVLLHILYLHFTPLIVYIIICESKWIH